VVLQVEPLLLGLVVGEHVLARAVGVVAPPVFVDVVCDGRRYRAGAAGPGERAVRRVGVRVVVGDVMLGRISLRGFCFF
jgi:hypothetical protein